MGSDHDLNPLEWGWQLKDEHFEPCKMDSMAAPEFLLKIIQCQCKGDCDSCVAVAKRIVWNVQMHVQDVKVHLAATLPLMQET